MERRRTGRRGLTLLEVIVAMLVVSVLMGALYASFRTASVAERRGREAVDRLQAAGEAMRLIRADLLGAMQPTGRVGGRWHVEHATDGSLRRLTLHSNTGIEEVNFAGLSTADLDTGFAARWPVQAVGGDAQRVAWIVRHVDAPGGGGATFYRASSRNVLALDDEPVLREQAVLRGVQRVWIRFYDGQQWHDQWDSDIEGQRLPLAVELTIELSDSPRSASGFGPGDAGRRFTSVIRLPMSRMTEETGGIRR